jgi:hypothetical protein
VPAFIFEDKRKLLIDHAAQFFFPASILTSNVDPCSFTSVQEVVVIGSSVASIIHPLFKVIDDINLMRSSILLEFFCAYAQRSKKPVGKFNRFKNVQVLVLGALFSLL